MGMFPRTFRLCSVLNSFLRRLRTRKSSISIDASEFYHTYKTLVDFSSLYLRRKRCVLGRNRNLKNRQQQLRRVVHLLPMVELLRLIMTQKWRLRGQRAAAQED